MAELPPPPGYAPERVRDGDILHPLVKVGPIAYEIAEVFARDCVRQLRARRGAGTLSREHERFEAAYLGANIRLYRFYGATFYEAADELGNRVSLIVARPGKSPRKNAWGRYVNHYLAYTAPGFRRQGYATAAETALRAMWRDDGYDRVKTLCQSWLGFCYHEHMRDRVWGVKPGTGELVIDSPLTSRVEAGVPIKARQSALHPDREVTPGELVGILTDPAGRFRREPEEAWAVLAKRAYRRRNLPG
jgi:mannose-6-phosphate isomerase-like protein (cupin superfamily)